jgi:hypothetical protein
LLKVQTERAERALEDEETAEEPGVDPNLNKLMADIFNQGARLLEIVDPAYRKSAKVQIGITGSQVSVGDGSTHNLQQQLVAKAVAALEARGFSRDEITEDMMKEMLQVLAGTAPAPKAIEGTVE